MRIAITGATSFIGRNLVKCLTQNDIDCVAVVRRNADITHLAKYGCEIIELNMDEYKTIRSYVGDVDGLVNLAWLGTRGLERTDRDIQYNSYRYTLDAIDSYGNSSCKLIVTAGSQAEYGNIINKITEETIPNPNTEYGRYKLLLYEKVKDFAFNRGIRFIEPRFFSLYGPGDNENTLIVSLIKKMLRNEDCDLTQAIQMWDYLYIDDAVSALKTLIIDDKACGIYNFASGDNRELRLFVEEIKHVLKSNSQLNFGKIPYPTTGMVSFMPDVSKIESTGWKAKIPFSLGIERVKDYLCRQ